MLADGRLYMGHAWRTVAIPSLAICLVVLSANFLGDGLPDRPDPTLRGRV